MERVTTVVGNRVGGLTLVGLTLDSTHIRTAPSRTPTVPVDINAIVQEKVPA